MQIVARFSIGKGADQTLETVTNQINQITKTKHVEEQESKAVLSESSTGSLLAVLTVPTLADFKKNALDCAKYCASQDIDYEFVTADDDLEQEADEVKPEADEDGRVTTRPYVRGKGQVGREKAE